MKKTKVVIAQLGSPKTPTTKDVRSYLKEFLGDPRVVDINPLLWKIILNCFVLPFRPKKSAHLYSRIWDEKNKSFPLISISESFVEKLRTHLVSDEVEIDLCFLLSHPKPLDVFAAWEQEDELTRADSVLLLPQFPQYSESTIASVFDNVAKDAKYLVNIPNLTFVSHYHNAKCFIDFYVRSIKKELDLGFDELVISFHGIPLRRVLQKKDIYYRHCFETFTLIKQRLEIADEKIHFTFQSRFGSEQWLGPSTEDYAIDLAKNGAKKIVVACPSFTVDCLETIDEIGNELSEEVHEFGTEVVSAKCPNDSDQWVSEYAHFIKTNLYGSEEEKRKLYYEIDNGEIMNSIPEQVEESPPLTKEMKGTLKIVFLSIFLDLIGFSIIFPLFPEMIKYYLKVDPDSSILNLLWGNIQGLVTANSTEVTITSFRSIALFGGVLGALYSFLQFLAAPYWGKLSDKIGRKPVMFYTVFGLAISYLIWFFSGSFLVLIIARILGGIMGGNLSTATAIVSDITDKKRRSKGMAFVGIAFAFGFIFGPAIGGILSKVRLDLMFPALTQYGVNPFSAPALFAAILSFINLWMINKRFKESLPKENFVKEHFRSSNVLKLFKTLPFAGVNQTNFANFFFIAAFSGMEFTLTFLALERLGYDSLDNAMMFLFIGFMIALDQGGFVRRKAHQIGEKKVVLMGLILLVPGLISIYFSYATWLLYIGLFFLSMGSAMIVPCLTSLVSFYAPEESQGEAIGIFRSLGSLGRVIGPIVASIIYWKYGAGYPYLIGTFLLCIPFLLVLKLPMIKAD